MSNKEIADLLRRVAAALEVKGKNSFKIAAYEKAASTIEQTDVEIKSLWQENRLQEISGIGINIAKHLNELFEKGEVNYFEKIFQDLPQGMFELLNISGIGPKTAYKLCLKLKIENPKNAIDQLEEAAKKGKIKKIEGFGEQSEKDILEGIKQYKNRDERMLLPFAWELSQKIINYLEKDEKNLRIDPLGSLRRMSSTIGDIDLAVATDKPQEIIKKFIKFPEIKEIIVAGKNTARIIHQNGRQIDLKTMKPEAYGALLQHFTGSKQHNIHLREVAIKKGLSLSEYGIKRQGKLENFHFEKEFYKALGMEWIPPELREDKGEIEAAQKNKLPKLIELKDIRGDLHIHSDFPIESSHDLGADSIEILAKKAQDLGYEYLGLSEHNPSFSQHSSQQILDILKRKREKIDKLNYSRTRKLSFSIINSLEIDIKPDGNLAIPEKGFDFLDLAIASIHSSFKMNQKEMTKRVLHGLVHPKVKIFGHPTGRKLGEREPYNLNWEQIFSFCLKNNKWLEINAFPNRLDLPDSLVYKAVKAGVKMIIDTDSHTVDQLNLMIYGISVARRGWATKNDIINTMSYNQIAKLLNLKGLPLSKMKGGE
ncbi:MAG: DNA polymerase/3'-5' exonuclease PolX [Candidatus Shapirobacteria bacterium]|nr:DNA polymerase/3'-5' exonuclease PolX [Candidatus Shapirobacteria bacterium]